MLETIHILASRTFYKNQYDVRYVLGLRCAFKYGRFPCPYEASLASTCNLPLHQHPYPPAAVLIHCSGRNCLENAIHASKSEGYLAPTITSASPSAHTSSAAGQSGISAERCHPLRTTPPETKMCITVDSEQSRARDSMIGQGRAAYPKTSTRTGPTNSASKTPAMTFSSLCRSCPTAPMLGDLLVRDHGVVVAQGALRELLPQLAHNYAERRCEGREPAPWLEVAENTLHCH